MISYIDPHIHMVSTGYRRLQTDGAGGLRAGQRACFLGGF